MRVTLGERTRSSPPPRFYRPTPKSEMVVRPDQRGMDWQIAEANVGER